MAFSFELKLAISSELYGAISAGPEQLVERRFCTPNVAGSSPVTSSTTVYLWHLLSFLAVQNCHHKEFVLEIVYDLFVRSRFKNGVVKPSTVTKDISIVSRWHLYVVLV